MVNITQKKNLVYVTSKYKFMNHAMGIETTIPSNTQGTPLVHLFTQNIHFIFLYFVPPIKHPLRFFQLLITYGLRFYVIEKKEIFIFMHAF